MGLAGRLELLIFELRLAGVPAEMLAPLWEAIDGLLRPGRDAVKSGRRTEQAMRRSREQLR
jgi:hypothetical protein